MEILKNFNDDTFELIADSQSYVLPERLGFGDGYGAIIKLSVFSNGSFQGDYQLEQNRDFYIKNNQIYLKPNEVLDRNNFSEGNYTLQFDFLKRYDNQDLYVAEVSPSRKEIRLRYQNVNDNELPKVNENVLTSFLNEEFTNPNPLMASPSLSIKNMSCACDANHLLTILKLLNNLTTLFGTGVFNLKITLLPSSPLVVVSKA